MTNFSEEQKQYFQGFFAGTLQSGVTPFAGVTAEGTLTHDPSAAPENLAAAPEDASEPASLFGTPYKKLNKEEKLKLEKDPYGMWDQMVKMAENNEMAEGGDVFRFKFHGLFNTAPTQEGYMLRCRMPGCCITSSQMNALADIAGNFGGDYSHVTTRGNLQIREIPAKHSVDTLLTLADAGLTSKGAGGDNIRNITCSPTSGVDPEEILDCRPYASAMHHYILNTKEFFGLPRKFNISFDGGGAVSIMTDTNDIGFFIEEENGEVFARVHVGGVAGHGHFAHDLNIRLKPEQMVAFAAAIIRVFVANGNRSNRKRARLAYCVEAMGQAEFLEEVKSHLNFEVLPAEPRQILKRKYINRFAHIGWHPQKQEGLLYVGVAMLVGRMSTEQMRQLSEIARRYGADTLHFTIWQNVILTGIREADREKVDAALKEAGFSSETSCASACLAACTGNTGCKLSQTDTKGCAASISEHLEKTLTLKNPLSIVLTGCPNSCAQHLVADIGLLGIKTKCEGASVEAYNISIGGGTEHDQGFARDLLRGITYDKVPATIEKIVKFYQQEKEDAESFVSFARRQEPEEFAARIQSPLENVS